MSHDGKRASLKEEAESTRAHRHLLDTVLQVSRDLADFLADPVQALMFTEAKVEHLRRLAKRLRVNADIASEVFERRRAAPTEEELQRLLNEELP